MTGDPPFGENIPGETRALGGEGSPPVSTMFMSSPEH